jgi:outer membrane immunogenic protein
LAFRLAWRVSPGWIVGAGFECAFAGPWSAKLEYDYMNFSTDRVAWTVINAALIQANIAQDVHILKAGFNYRFGGLY